MREEFIILKIKNKMYCLKKEKNIFIITFILFILNRKRINKNEKFLFKSFIH